MSVPQVLVSNGIVPEWYSHRIGIVLKNFISSITTSEIRTYLELYIPDVNVQTWVYLKVKTSNYLPETNKCNDLKYQWLHNNDISNKWFKQYNKNVDRHMSKIRNYIRNYFINKYTIYIRKFTLYYIYILIYLPFKFIYNIKFYSSSARYVISLQAHVNAYIHINFFLAVKHETSD